VVLEHAAFSSWLCGDTEEADALSRRGLELGAEHGLDEASDLFTLFRGAALVQAGRIDEGLAMLREGFGRYAATAARLASPMFTAFAASCLQAGEITEGLAVVEQALDPSRSMLDHMFEAELWRLKGDLLLARDLGGAPSERRGRRKRTGEDLEGAEGCLERALATSRRRNARGLELRAASSLARLRRERGDLEGARDLLAPIVATFEEGHDTPDLRAASRLLRELDREGRQAR
jgi:tetratricopeptide (TPR) repeat protein